MVPGSIARLVCHPGSFLEMSRKFVQNHPIPRKLANRLEELYMLVKPWLSSYQLELSKALELGPEAHAKLKQPLDETQSVVFEDSTKAYIVS